MDYEDSFDARGIEDLKDDGEVQQDKALTRDFYSDSLPTFHKERAGASQMLDSQIYDKYANFV